MYGEYGTACMSAAQAVPTEIIKTVAANMFFMAPSHVKELKTGP